MLISKDDSQNLIGFQHNLNCKFVILTPLLSSFMKVQS